MIIFIKTKGSGPSHLPYLTLEYGYDPCLSLIIVFLMYIGFVILLHTHLHGELFTPPI